MRLGTWRVWHRENYLRRAHWEHVGVHWTLSADPNILITYLRHVSDFRAPIPIDPEEKFTDLIYAEWDLVKRSKRPDWDCHPSTWKW